MKTQDMKTQIQEAAEIHTSVLEHGNDYSVLDFKAGAEWMQEQYKGLTPETVFEMRDKLSLLVGRINEHWDLITSGTQNGIKTALIKEADEVLCKVAMEYKS